MGVVVFPVRNACILTGMTWDAQLKRILRRVRKRRWQIGIGTFLGVLIAVGLSQVEWNPDTGPCASGKYLVRCFQVDRPVCESAHKDFSIRCNQVASKLKLPPARLMDPIVRNCVELRYGRVFPFLRNADIECVARQKDLDQWVQSNPDFSFQ